MSDNGDIDNNTRLHSKLTNAEYVRHLLHSREYWFESADYWREEYYKLTVKLKTGRRWVVVLVLLLTLTLSLHLLSR